MCFELASGLKVNYSKSRRKGISSFQLSRFAYVLNCVVKKAHFTYLGMKVGGNHKRLGFWEVVLEKIGEVERKILSMTGRICLIKSIFTCIPLFYISCFLYSRVGHEGTGKNDENVLVGLGLGRAKNSLGVLG